MLLFLLQRRISVVLLTLMMITTAPQPLLKILTLSSFLLSRYCLGYSLQNPLLANLLTSLPSKYLFKNYYLRIKTPNSLKLHVSTSKKCSLPVSPHTSTSMFTLNSTAVVKYSMSLCFWVVGHSVCVPPPLLSQPSSQLNYFFSIPSNSPLGENRTPFFFKGVVVSLP